MAYWAYPVRVGTTFHFRFTLPPYSLGNSKAYQIKRSLGVHEVRVAKKLSRYLATQLELFVGTLNLGSEAMDQSKRKQILATYLDSQIAEWKSSHAHGPRLTKAEINQMINDAKGNREDILWNIMSSNLKPSLEKVKSIYKKNGIEENADKNDAYDLAKMEMMFYEFIEKTLSGKIVQAEKIIDENRAIISPVSNMSGKYVVEEKDGPLISSLIEEYLAENKIAWSDGTYRVYSLNLKVFLRNIKDCPINKFDLSAMNEFRNKLRTLPKSSSKTGEIISAVTANNILRSVSSFQTWCTSERGVIERNVALRKSLPLPRDKKNRERFTKEDLELIFSQDRFKNPDMNRICHYWVPIISYYTGARLAEVALLRKEDIFKVDDIWAISINNKHRSIKRKSSIRDIPICDDLLKLGFIHFVEKCGEGFIFQIKGISKPINEVVGEGFTRFKKNLGFGSNKVFHCFRNTFIDEVYQQGLDMVLYKDYIGHQQTDVTHGIYASKASVKRLKEGLLDKMVFPVDLSEML